MLVTTLTRKMAEDLTQYYHELGVRVRYLHSDIDTLERIEILRDLRRGEFDVLVGINLLREGLDLPEVSLVAILDAGDLDVEGDIFEVLTVLRDAAPHDLRFGPDLVRRVFDAARELVAKVGPELAELFVYPGDRHLFTDSSLPSYDADATALVVERSRKFLDRLG